MIPITRLITICATEAHCGMEVFPRKRRKAVASSEKFKSAVSSGWLKSEGVYNPNDIIDLP